MKPNLSVAAAGLLRALIARTGVDRDRLLITGWTSHDWQSLTFIGERHEAVFRIIGPDAARIAASIGDGLEDHEFALPGLIVAEIALTSPPRAETDGSVLLTIEALTITE